MARQRSLTKEQADELRSRYALYQANTPQRLAREYGIAISSLYTYTRGMHKDPRPKVEQRDEG